MKFLNGDHRWCVPLPLLKVAWMIVVTLILLVTGTMPALAQGPDSMLVGGDSLGKPTEAKEDCAGKVGKERALPARDLLCYCSQHCPPDVINSTCRTSGFCFAIVEEDESGEIVLTAGCMKREGSEFQCRDSPNSRFRRTIECCTESDFCNRLLQPTLPPTPPTTGFFDSSIHRMTLFAAAAVFMVLFLILMVMLYIRYKRQEACRRGKKWPMRDELIIPGTGTMEDIMEEWQSSGSGSGLPLLVPRTIGKQVSLVRELGRGRFGEVWLGKWRDEAVAVKVYFSLEEATWLRETEIYQSVLMRHENVLGFIAADIKAARSGTQRLLITDYLEGGALQDYLRAAAIDGRGVLRLAYSAASGLCYLHTEIHGTRGKPGVAHCNLSSRTLLVRRDGTCAIAELGLAAVFNSETNEVDLPASQRLGPARYCAPEVLDQSLNRIMLPSFLMADIYSLGLIFWEIARRCTCQGVVNDYRPPYFEVVPSEPSYSEMREVVCVKQLRPQIPYRWNSEEVLRPLSKLMAECWASNPSSRLTALRVKKSLAKMAEAQDIKIP
uniref:bone morphogenetic protein receptor type-1B-like n=1 Tax=Myxine glutinosa TaxID=7769 RepID=UPI00358E5346